jgi:hypothetical protein
MSRPQSIAYVWREVEIITNPETGEVLKTGAMVPSPRYREIAKRQFAAGGEHVLEEVAERSMASHSHYFATLHDLFDNVPEKMAPRWPSCEHWRAWLLIETGFFEEKEFDMNSEKHAKALATFVRINSPFARISIHGPKVIVRTAKSQSMKAMGKEDFQKSKDAVLDLASQLVGVSKAEAMKNSGRAA